MINFKCYFLLLILIFNKIRTLLFVQVVLARIVR